MKQTMILLYLVLANVCFSQQGKEPIIDMHLHAFPYNENGPEPVPFCYPISTVIPYMDATENGMEVFMKKMTEPTCEDPIWSPKVMPL